MGGRQNLETRVQLEDLERRLQKVEEGLGLRHESFSLDQLLTLYVDAARPKNRSAADALLWQKAVMSLTAHQLLLLAREVTDPFPWRTFAFVLRQLAEDGHDTEAALEHLRNVGRSMLDAQGFGNVEVGDIEWSPLAIHRAISSISRRTAEEDHVQEEEG